MARIPNQVLIVPVNEPVGARQTNPEIIVNPGEAVLQPPQKIVLLAGTQLQPAAPAPEGNGEISQSTLRLSVEASSFTTSLLNNSVYPSSRTVSSTVGKSTVLSTLVSKFTFIYICSNYDVQ